MFWRVWFIFTDHLPEVYGEFSCHGGDGFVFVSCIAGKFVEGFSGMWVLCDPDPCALYEIGA